MGESPEEVGRENTTSESKGLKTRSSSPSQNMRHRAERGDELIIMRC